MCAIDKVEGQQETLDQVQAVLSWCARRGEKSVRNWKLKV